MQTRPPGTFTAAASPPTTAPAAQPWLRAATRATAARPDHEQVVVEAADPVREHQRARQHQRGHDGRVAARPSAARRGSAQARASSPSDGHQPVRDHEQPGVVEHLGGEPAAEQRQRTVRRGREHPARVDRLDDRPVEDARAPDVRRDSQPGQLALRGVAPAVPAEQRRRHHQREAPHRGDPAYVGDAGRGRVRRRASSRIHECASRPSPATTTASPSIRPCIESRSGNAMAQDDCGHGRGDQCRRAGRGRRPPLRWTPAMPGAEGHVANVGRVGECTDTSA